MGLTNSPLAAFTQLSPNHSGLRTKRIDRISPHCVVLSENWDNTTYPRKILIRVDIQKVLISYIFRRMDTG